MLQKIFKELGAESRREKIILTAKFVGALAGGIAFGVLVMVFMWACYYAGVPM